MEALKKYDSNEKIIQFSVIAGRKKKSRQKVAAPKNQTMEPIESREDVNRIVAYCLDRDKLRDALLLVMGFNTGLRVSDLILIQVGDVLRDGKIVESFRVNEQKTQHVRDKKPVTIYINRALKEMLTVFLKGRDLDPEAYLFENQSYCPGSQGRGNHISRQAAWQIVKRTIKNAGIDGQYGTHTLRKTPVFQILTSETIPENNIVKNEVGLQAAQRFLNHNNAASTFHYVGILEKQRKAEIMRLNLGLEAILEYKLKQKG